MAIVPDQWHRFANAPQSLQQTFLATPYPADPEVMEKYAHINPKGRFCEVDMEAADRLLRIRAAAEVASPENKAFVTEALDAMRNKEDGNKIHRTYNAMLNSAKNRRTMDREMQLKQSVGSGESFRRNREHSIKTNENFINCDTMLQGLETVVGLREGPLSDAVKNQFAGTFAKPITDELVESARTRGVAPPSISVNFANFDNVAQGINKSKPENWRKETESVSRELSPEETTRVMTRYANATVDTALSPIFDGMDARMKGPAHKVPNRASLVTVDGKTVREMIGEQFQADPKNKGLDLKSSEYEAFYQKNQKQLTTEFVSAGLMAGKRVEMFVPDPKTGTISNEPTQLTKKGYEPEPLTKVTMNGWERFFSRRGFYKEKTAQLAEYNRVMDSRQRVTNDFVTDIAHELGGAQPHTKDIYFKEAVESVGATHIDDEQFRSCGYGSIDRSACTSACQCRLLAGGHSFEDVYDNSKLLEEKAAIGKEYLQHLMAKDKDWLAEGYVAGNKIIHQEIEKRQAGRRFDSKDAVGKDVTLLIAMTGTGFDTDQELGKCKPEAEKVVDRYYPAETHAESMVAYNKAEKQLSNQALMTDFIAQGASARSAAYSNGNTKMTKDNIIAIMLQERIGRKTVNDLLDQDPSKALWDLTDVEVGVARITSIDGTKEIMKDMEGMSEVGQARVMKAMDNPKFFEKSGYGLKEITLWKGTDPMLGLVRTDEEKVKAFMDAADTKSEKTQRAVDKMEKSVAKDQAKEAAKAAKQEAKDAKKQEGPARKR